MKFTWTEFKQKNGATMFVATRGVFSPGCTVHATIRYVAGRNLPWRWATDLEGGSTMSVSAAKKVAAAAVRLARATQLSTVVVRK